MMALRMNTKLPAELAVPPALKPGDGISIVAPASSPRRKRLDTALANLTSAGYRPKLYRDVCSSDGYLSGSDQERVAELEAAFRDPETTMILAARGGYGVGRILSRVDFRLLTQQPKIVCGYSDLTALHTAIQRRSGLVSFHGPNLIDGLGDTQPDTVPERDASMALFSGRCGAGIDLLAASQRVRVLTQGIAEGRLVGGNLAVFTSLMGTPDQPDTDGSILLIEDVHEPPYRVDRLLNQLRASGILSRISGAVVGYFTDVGNESGPTVEQVIRSFLEPLGVPVLLAAPSGHEHPNLPLPLGAAVRLQTEGRQLLLMQNVVG